jgi:ATP-dependent exoDNAse (exonuclease V) beta subunit
VTIEGCQLLSKRNKDRHPTVQNFMLINDTATIAVEVPVYLYANEIPELNLNKPITGHIDVLQVRWDKVWILDYKPEAKYNRVNSAHQVFLYRLALSRRTGIPFENINCAYFDDKDYFETVGIRCL